MGEPAKDWPRVDGLWDYRDPASSEARFRDLLDELAQTPDEDQGQIAYRVEVLTQLARALGLQQQFDAGSTVLEEAEARVTSATPPVGPVRILLERGRLLNSAGRPSDAVEVFEQALAEAEAHGLEYYAVDAAHMLGIATTGDTSVNWNRRAISLAESASDPRTRRWLGSLYNNLGWTFFDMSDYASALELFERDFAFRTAHGLPVEAGIARWSVAKALRYLGRLDEAYSHQLELLADPTRHDNAAEGYTQEELGECLLGLGRAEEAQGHFARAYLLLKADPWLVRDEPERLLRLQSLGQGFGIRPESR